MRLSSKAAAVIREAARRHFGPQAEVWLFGSRADDALRGGDIDLYIELSAPVKERTLKTCRMDVDIQKALGEQKIDILVSDPSLPRWRIHEIARQNGIHL